MEKSRTINLLSTAIFISTVKQTFYKTNTMRRLIKPNQLGLINPNQLHSIWCS